MKSVRWMPEGAEDIGAWRGRHTRAVERGLNNVHGHRGAKQGDSLIQAINAWCEYARAYEQRYESTIGNDLVGDWWKDWGLALKRLLDAESGDLSCGVLCQIIWDNLLEQGFKEEQLS
jgi:hypothetical protein